LLLFTFGFLTWKGISPGRAGLATALLATAPLLFRHATIAYANLPLAYALLCGMVMLSEALHGQGDLRSHQPSLLAGAMLVAAAWTRPEGLALALAGLLAMAGMYALRGGRLASIQHIAFLALPLAGYALMWVALRGAAYTRPTGQGDMVGNALAAIYTGQLHLSEMVYILRRLVVDLFDPVTWGVLGVALLVAAWLSLRRRPRHSQASSLALPGLVFLAAILGMYYLTSYDTTHDISWWVSTGLGRMLLPAVCLLWVGLFLGAQPLDHREDGSLPTDLEHNGRLGVKL
jgi:hypothetical protein